MIVSGLEELVHGEGLLAAWAVAAGTKAAHESPAVLTALEAEEPGATARALVDGAGLSGPGGWQFRGSLRHLAVVASPDPGRFTLWALTEMSSAPSWFKPAWPRPATTPWRRCWLSPWGGQPKGNRHQLRDQVSGFLPFGQLT